MVEKYEPQPFEKRPSQNVGIGHYLKELSPILGLAALGAATGWTAAKAGISRYSPGVSATIGGKATALVSAFLIWRKHEKARMGVKEIYKDLKSVESMHLTNEDLIKDNDVLKKMIEFEKRNHDTPSGTSFAERISNQANEAEQNQSPKHHL